MKMTVYGCSVASIIFMASTTQAYAASASEPEQTGEIVVTAQKKSESLQRAAITVHALQSGDLEKTGIKNGLDLQYVDPAIKIAPSIQPNISIRGLGTANFNPGVDPSVAFNQDGIYLSTSNALTPVLFDMERIEAVLGPQGTLYGRNSNSGTINFITRDPSFKLGGYLKAGAGNYGALDSEAALNVPLSSTLAVRVSGGTERRDGFNANGTNDLNSVAGRMKILYQPSDKLRALLTLDTSTRKSFATSYDGTCPPNLTNIAACNGVSFDRWTGMLPAQRSGYSVSTVYGIAAQLEYNLGWSKLVSLTGYKDTNWRNSTSAGWYGGVNNFDFIANIHDKFFTQELRLASDASSPVSWVVGGFYSNLDQTGITQNNYYTNTFVQLGGGPANFYQAFPQTASTARSIAAFGDVTVPLKALSGFSLVGGLRFTHETKDTAGLVTSGLTSPSVLFPGTLPTSGQTSLNRVTWKAGFKYQFTKQNLLYSRLALASIRRYQHSTRRSWCACNLQAGIYYRIRTGHEK